MEQPITIHNEVCTSEMFVATMDDTAELTCKELASAVIEHLTSLVKMVNSPVICSVAGEMDKYDALFRLRATNQCYEHEQRIPKTFMEDTGTTSKPFKVHTEQKFTLTTTINGGTHRCCMVDVDVEMYDPDATSGEITRKEQAERIAWMALYPFYCNNDGRFTALKFEGTLDGSTPQFTTVK